MGQGCFPNGFYYCVLVSNMLCILESWHIEVFSTLQWSAHSFDSFSPIFMKIHLGIRNLWHWDAFSLCCCLGGHIAPVHKSCSHRAYNNSMGIFDPGMFNWHHGLPRYLCQKHGDWLLIKHVGSLIIGYFLWKIESKNGCNYFWTLSKKYATYKPLKLLTIQIVHYQVPNFLAESVEISQNSGQCASEALYCKCDWSRSTCVTIFVLSLFVNIVIFSSGHPARRSALLQQIMNKLIKEWMLFVGSM